jgi:capsular exopolysaccharide synthesis family protein
MSQRGISKVVRKIAVTGSEVEEVLISSEQSPAFTPSPDPNSRMVCLGNIASIATEQFNVLGIRLKCLRQRRELKKVLITSSMPEEGKSVIAVNLAASMARDKKEQVVLLEGDLRRPTISQRLGCERPGGLTDYLQGNLPLRELVYRVDPQGFYFVPGGRTANNTFELLQSKKLPELIEHLARLFDWIIVDSTPILPLADASIWTKLVDGILLVTRQGKTEKLPLQKAIATLDRSLLLGLVLNGFADTMQHKYSHYYKHYRSPIDEYDDSNGHNVS